jgi:hypothetical protein
MPEVMDWSLAIGLRLQQTLPLVSITKLYLEIVFDIYAQSTHL